MLHWISNYFGNRCPICSLLYNFGSTIARDRLYRSYQNQISSLLQSQIWRKDQVRSLRLAGARMHIDYPCAYARMIHCHPYVCARIYVSPLRPIVRKEISILISRQEASVAKQDTYSMKLMTGIINTKLPIRPCDSRN